MNGDITTDEKEQYLNIIKKRAKLLQDLLDNYYDLVQAELEQQELQMNTLNVGKLINDVLATFYYDFSDRGIAVEIEEGSKELTIMADEKLLQRVFVNLLQNVLNHGCEQCIISHINQNRTVIKNKVLSVKQVEIKKVFNRLYSADKTRNTGNTGIGLTITKRIIILSTHIVSDVAYIADTILMMKKGEIIMQSPTEKATKTISGKVWELVVDIGELNTYTKVFTVANLQHENNKVRLRIIHETAPSSQAKAVEATLDDLFLYHFGELHADGGASNVV